jgi:uncharacterized protein YyaL (SSP411 family)
VSSQVNRLINETSPYLLQHAHNPVDWFPWSDEALTKARQENKPILVSIGYAACHWCHVMEKESFEDPATAHLMNRYFVCIKIDREERPDLDHFFMDALQAIAGNGGWPLNMFLTPEAKPFYGGTYFPPEPIHNRISWKQLLVNIHDAFQKRRDEMEEQAMGIIAHLSKYNQVNEKMKERFRLFTDPSYQNEDLQKIQAKLLESADQVNGGFGRAPKFPQTFSLQYLLRFFHFTGDTHSKEQALLSLDKMMQGGIYDHIGGGFCRYSTDNEWLAPHFEKMTYDNALLVILYTEAYQLTGNNAYKRVVEETMDFMCREMLSSEGGFYAALDADSEGVEGKFYTWSAKEFDEIIPDQRISDLFDISDKGNWEQVNIPRMKRSLSDWAAANALDEEVALSLVKSAKAKLLSHRAKRVRPLTDDKIILGWNALFNQALTRAGLACQRMDWIDLAKRNMDFLINSFYDPSSGKWQHTYKAGQAKFPAFLDDLAYLVQSLIFLYEGDPDTGHLDQAVQIMDYVLENFSDEEQVYFLFTPGFEKEVPVRKMDLYDGALPSGNATMAWNLYRLSLLLNKPNWKKRAGRMLEGTRDAVAQWPNSFGIWANLMLELVEGTVEIAVVGDAALTRGRELLRNYIPNRVFMSAKQEDNRYPLLRDKVKTKETAYYLCQNYACQLPFYTEPETIKAISRIP